MESRASSLREEQLARYVEAYRAVADLFELLVAEGGEDAAYQAQVESMEAFDIYRIKLARFWDRLAPEQQGVVEEADRKLIELDAAVSALAGVSLAESVDWARSKTRSRPAGQRTAT